MELVNAFKKGDWLTRSSAIVMGLGNILRKQFIKGILFLFTEAAFLFFMAAYGWQCLLALPGLGEKEQGEVWNETLGVYEYVQGDNSLLILLYGIAVLFICAAAVVLLIPELLRALLFYQYKISNILYMLHHNHTTNIFHHTAQSVPGTFFHKQLFPALSFRFFSAM